MPTLTSTMRATAEAFLGAFVRASQTKNISKMSANCTQDCIRAFGPASYLELVGAPADYTMTNAEYEAQFSAMAFYELTDTVISRLVVDAEEFKAAAISEIVGQFVDGRKISRTNVWFLEFTPDGEKVCRAYQHIDHHEGQEFRRVLAAYKEAREKEERDGDGVYAEFEDEEG